MSTTAKKVAIVTMSTRKPRIGPEVAKLVLETITPDAATHNVQLTPLDLDDFKLPLFDEPVAPAMIPAMGQYQHEHTKAWTAAIAAHDGYVLVIPEYNFGMAGATKNAIDFLYNEWIGKPVALVSYGIKGGVNAAEAAVKTLTGMKLKVMETRPALTFEKGPEPGDIVSALNKGAIGEESLAAWRGQGEEIRKAFGEVRAELVGDILAEEAKEGDKA